MIWTDDHTGFNRIKADVVSAVSLKIVMFATVSFVMLIVDTVSSVMLTPDPARIKAQTMPGMT